MEELHLVIAVRGTAEDDVACPMAGTDKIAIGKGGALHNVRVVSLADKVVFSGQLVNQPGIMISESVLLCSRKGVITNEPWEYV